MVLRSTNSLTLVALFLVSGCVQVIAPGEDVDEVAASSQPTPSLGEPQPDDPIPLPPSEPQPEPENSCIYAFDGICDDGRPGAATADCGRFTDQSDCIHVVPPRPSPEPIFPPPVEPPMGSRVTFEDAAEACADVLFDLENPSVQALADAFFAVLIINEWNAAFQGIAKQERLDGFNEECKRESSLLRIIRCQDCFAAIVEAGYAATIDDINALNDLNQ